MKTTTALACILALLSTASAKEATKSQPAPAAAVAPAAAKAGDGQAPDALTAEGKKKKLAGFITTHIGVGMLLAGMTMLIISAVDEDVRTDGGLKRGLDTGGGILTGIGATGIFVGALIWVDGRQDLKEAKAKASARIFPTLSTHGGGVAMQLRF